MPVGKKLKRHLRRCSQIRRINAERRRILNASSGVTSSDGCDNQPLSPQCFSSAVEASKLVKEEVHGEDATSDKDSNNHERVSAATTPDKNGIGDELADEEEVAIPVKQLEAYTKARVIDKPVPKPKKVLPLPLKPRPPIPSPSFCFVCVSRVDRQQDTTTNVTNADCVFLIKEMLELPKLETDDYMDRLKEPEMLIGLCVKCLEVIREAVKLKKQISELEVRLKTCQRQIVKTMKGTELNSFTGKGVKPSGVGGGREKRIAIENLLRFVYKRKYYSVLSSQTVVGKMKDARSGLDAVAVTKEVTVASAPTAAPHRSIKAVRSQPISQLQKKSKTIQPRKPSWIISTPCPNKKMYLVCPKSTPQPSGRRILKSSSGEIPIPNVKDCEDLSKDPLALDDENEDILSPEPPDQKPDKIECGPKIPNPPISLASSPAPVQYIICGLCNDDKRYKTVSQLHFHTIKIHGRPNPQHQPPNEVPSLTKSSDNKPLLKEPTTLSSSLEEEKISKKPQEVTSPPKSSDNRPTLKEPSTSSRLNQEKMERSIIKARKILVHPPIPPPTKAPMKIYNIQKLAKLPPPNFEKQDVPGNALYTRSITTKTNWRTYDCPMCPAIKGYKLNRFIQHLAIHQRRPYRCTVCCQLFPEDEAIMEEHWKDKHSDAPIPSTSSALEPPEKFVKLKLKPGQIWKCDGCRCFSAFITEEARDDHEIRCAMFQRRSRSMPTVPIQCSTCKKSSRNMTEWRLHRALNHPEVHRTCCLFCDKSFAEKTVEGVEFRRDKKMIEHIQKEHKKLSIGCGTLDECEACGVVFNQVTEFETHFLNVHGVPIGERKFSCPICNLKLARKRSLTVHINQCHFPREPLICDICGISFLQTNKEVKMAEHKLQKHGILPERVKLYSCPEKGCQFRTAFKVKMDVHSQREHGRARRYTCKHCGKGFMALGHLKQHELMHENKLKKPYQCEICGNSFAIRNYLYIHKRLSHEGRTFPSTNRKRVAKPGNQRLKRPRVEAVPVTTEGRPNEVVAPAKEL